MNDSMISLRLPGIYYSLRPWTLYMTPNREVYYRQDNCNVRGYFVWSLLDNWEWNLGYTVRFGLYFVDYKNNLTRIPKTSVPWFRSILRSNGDLRNQF